MSETQELESRPGYVWVEDRRWRILPAGSGARCRAGAGGQHPACGAPAVAQFSRRHNRDTRWWSYCQDHMYGRRLVGGRIWLEVTAGSPVAERGWTE